LSYFGVFFKAYFQCKGKTGLHVLGSALSTSRIADQALSTEGSLHPKALEGIL